MHKRLIALALGGAVLLCWHGSAWGGAADSSFGTTTTTAPTTRTTLPTGGGAHKTGPNGVLYGGSDDPHGGGFGAPIGPIPNCTWKGNTYKTEFRTITDQARIDQLEAAQPHLTVGEVGWWRDRFCNGNLIRAGEWRLAPGAAAATPGSAAERLALLPDPGIQLNPATEGVVNMQTWVWVTAASIADQHPPPVTTANGTTVTVTAKAVKVTFDMGDGSPTFDCTNGGTPYTGDPAATTDCSHTWTHSSAGEPHGDAYLITATTTWAATWTANGPNGPQAGTIPAITTTSQTLERVSEIQALNTES